MAVTAGADNVNVNLHIKHVLNNTKQWFIPKRWTSVVFKLANEAISW